MDHAGRRADHLAGPAPMIPGEMRVAAGDIELNKGRKPCRFRSTNTGRPADPGRLALSLLRDQRRAEFRAQEGLRLPAEHRRGHGGALRAGPEAHGGAGRARGRPQVFGFTGAGHGNAQDEDHHAQAYAEMFGPTVGDRVRLADTELLIEVENDFTDLRRGSEVRRRQSDPRRHGPEPARRRRTSPTP